MPPGVPNGAPTPASAIIGAPPVPLPVPGGGGRTIAGLSGALTMPGEAVGSTVPGTLICSMRSTL
jgi:hypothetical protein